jgi:hypothetical protein
MIQALMKLSKQLSTHTSGLTLMKLSGPTPMHTSELTPKQLYGPTLITLSCRALSR